MSGIDTYTKIMLHFDGSAASTTITDSSLSPKTFTAAGNGQLDTAIKQFGTAALLCDGTGDYVTTTDHVDFTLASNDFTVDFWFNVSGGAGTVRRAYGQSDSGGTAPELSIFGQITSANLLTFSAITGTAVGTITSTTPITTSGWHHYAGVRTGNVMKLFIDGVQEGGDLPFTLPINDSASAFSIGRRGAATSNTWFGSIDEFRLSVGIARWTANFTPPSAAYSIDQTIDAQLFANSQTFFAATMVINQTVLAQLFTNTQNFFGATLSAVKSITGALVTNTQTFYGAVFKQVQAIMAQPFTNPQTFFSCMIEQTQPISTDVRELYTKTSASKVAFWNAVRASKFRSRN